MGTTLSLAAQISQRHDDPHIVVAISGGVDSSVTALLLKEAGYKVSAIFMKNWNEPEESGRCHWEDDVADALDVCERLDIPLNTIDLSEAYWHGVFEEFLQEYRRGRTPNPDILCNREVKFKAFLQHAQAVGGDLIATGHYARISFADGTYHLLKGSDPNKDQSYFLYTLGQHQMAATLFPIGEKLKPEIRALAKNAALENHAKKDSVGICFIGEKRFREFLAQYLATQNGLIRTLDGRTVGEHQGVAFYTLGQRQGLGVGGVKGASEQPWFVVGKDLARNELLVAQGHDHPALLNRRLTADTLSWTAAVPAPMPFRCCAKTRYRQADQECTIIAIENDKLSVEFDQPQRAMTPGQSVVFYRGAECLGGAVIDATS